MDITIKPKDISDAELVFGPRNIDDYLPKYSEIPDEFINGKSKWNRVISRWFFNGLPEGTGFAYKEGIDVSKAIRHISACLSSFEPKHERKEAGCAYLMSLWFDDLVNGNREVITDKI